MGTYVPYDPIKEQFLNNFYTRFPSGVGKYPQGLARATSASSWTETHSSYLKRMFDSEEKFIDFSSKYSDRYLAETPEAFFRELDASVVEVGLSHEEITVKIRALKAASEHLFESEDARRASDQASEAMNDYLTPLYVALRAKGYNKKELWG